MQGCVGGAGADGHCLAAAGKHRFHDLQSANALLAQHLGYHFRFGLAAIIAAIATLLIVCQTRPENLSSITKTEASRQVSRTNNSPAAVRHAARGSDWLAMLLAGLPPLLRAECWPGQCMACWVPVAMAALVLAVVLTVLSMLRLTLSTNHYVSPGNTVCRSCRASSTSAAGLCSSRFRRVDQGNDGRREALHVFVADSTPLYARAYVSPVLTFAPLWLLDGVGRHGGTGGGMAMMSLAMRGNGEMRRYHAAGRT